MNIYLIRHSLTASNLQNRYCGRTDDPLCPEGVALARASGCFPTVTRVFVTPLRRTGETAALLFPHAERTVVPGLAEMDFGDFENRSADDMADDAAYRAWVDGGCQGRCPNGEQVDEFCARVRTAFAQTVRQEREAERLERRAGEHDECCGVADEERLEPRAGEHDECCGVADEEHLIFVLHGGSIRAILSGFAEERRPFFDWYAKNCRGFRARLDWDADTPVLRACERMESLAL